MKLQSGPFERMKSGKKTLELRLYDEKRQIIMLGDEIEFSELPDLENKIKTRVVGLFRYDTFTEMLSDLPTGLLGYEESDRKYLETCMYEVYTKEQEAEYGVLGIRIKLLE
ncbi:MAG: hypothetical protein PHI66_00445 [Candidatus Pacebacteria bacterium]|nr:hypothetical protein [Candidatus Paceibacterota bacterium]